MDTSTLSWVIPLGLLVALLIFRRLGQVSSEQARRLVAEGARLIDVRTPTEFETGHLAGAVNVPLGNLASLLEVVGPKDQPKVLYCASGTRSALARSMLKGRGFSRVYNLGSMSRW